MKAKAEGITCHPVHSWQARFEDNGGWVLAEYLGDGEWAIIATGLYLTRQEADRIVAAHNACLREFEPEPAR